MPGSASSFFRRLRIWKSTARSALEAARQAANGEDVAAIKAAASELQQASHAMAEALYRDPAAHAVGTEKDRSADVKEGEVVDAAYSETR